MCAGHRQARAVAEDELPRVEMERRFPRDDRETCGHCGRSPRRAAVGAASRDTRAGRAATAGLATATFAQPFSTARTITLSPYSACVTTRPPSPARATVEARLRFQASRSTGFRARARRSCAQTAQASARGSRRDVDRRVLPRMRRGECKERQEAARPCLKCALRTRAAASAISRSTEPRQRSDDRCKHRCAPAGHPALLRRPSGRGHPPAWTYWPRFASFSTACAAARRASGTR